MNNEDIIAIIKWGPLIFFLLTFSVGMIVGLIKGRRKSLKKFIYSIIWVILVFFLTPIISKFLVTFEIKGISIEGYILDFIENNETVKNIFDSIPSLNDIIKTHPSAVISLILFVVLIFVGLPLSFPLYIIYSIIFNLISKYAFKYSKYKRDENGKILRNQKGKKIKIKHDKHRLTGGLIKGIEFTLLSSVILVPVGVVTRLYDDAKKATTNNDLSKIEYLEKYRDIISYVDAFNNSFVGKITNSALNETVTGYLNTVDIGGEKTTVEKELGNIVVAAIYLEESGLIKLLSQDIDIKTLNLDSINIDKVNSAINALFKSATLKSVISDGVNYVLENNLKDIINEYTTDEDIISKIKYNNATEIKEELLRVTDVVAGIINSKLLSAYQNNSENIVGIVNEVNTSDVETILNKVLSIKILSESMPGIVSKLLEDQGLQEELTNDDNDKLVNILINMLKLVKTLDINNIEDITNGDVMSNLTNALYIEGAIKENSKDALTTLLADITSSDIFDDVLVTQLNKLLEKYEINLNSQMIINVNSKEEWIKELNVLEDVFKLYDSYNKEEKVDFLVARELLENLKDTKAMILAFPVAYQKLFPQVGIEIDSSKIQYIDYETSDAKKEEIEFYNYWKQQLTHLEVVSDELAKLNITSISDLSLDLLELDTNRISMSKIFEEVFTADLLKDGVAKLLNERMGELLVDYEINLNDDAIKNVNNVVKEMPYYIDVDNQEYEIQLNNNIYYINDEQVTISNNQVQYKGLNYQVNNNSLARIWKCELDNLSKIIKSIKTANYTDRDTLTIILNSVDSMRLLKDVKSELLLYAIKQIDLVDVSELTKDDVDFSKEKEILLNVIDKYDLLKDIDKIEFKDMDDQTIADLDFVLNNVLNSDIFGDYAADSIVEAAKENVELDKEKVKQSTTWESDLKLIRTALNMNKDSFDKNKIESLLEGIESSDLLKDSKEDLLLDTARKITITGISIPQDLTSDEIDYATEKNAILVASENLTMIEDMSGDDFDLDTVNSEEISKLLSVALKSKMFGDSVAINLANVFNKNSISHDLDVVDDTGNANLIESIKNINNKDNVSQDDEKAKENWKSEIKLIQDLLKVNTKEKVNTDLFTRLESSILLGGCRANLLSRMVTEINKLDSSLELSNVSVLDLVGSDGKYTQYGIEKQVLIDLTGVDDIKIGSITDIDKDGTILNNMKNSKIFDKEYYKSIKEIITPIKDIKVSENDRLTDWGIKVNDEPQVADWKKELNSLLIIKDNIATVAAYTKEAAKNNTQKIADTLDAIDNSDILSGSDKVANKLASKIAGETIIINKGDSWKLAFDNLYNRLNA